MIFELEDISKVTSLFDGWQETLIWSCLDRVMGRILVTDTEKPVSLRETVSLPEAAEEG